MDESEIITAAHFEKVRCGSAGREDYRSKSGQSQGAFKIIDGGVGESGLAGTERRK